MARFNTLCISHLRECLGYAYQNVAETGKPLVIQRYSRQDVVMVRLNDWKQLNRKAAGDEQDAVTGVAQRGEQRGRNTW